MASAAQSSSTGAFDRTQINSSKALCPVDGCGIPGRHLSDCPGADSDADPQADPDVEGCRGCLPRLAAPGLVPCSWHVDAATSAVGELAGLWVELAERATSGRSGGATVLDPEACPDCDAGLACDRGHREPTSPLGLGPIEARSTIRAHLVTWCRVLADKHSITLPDEAAIVATTRTIARYESIQAAAHRLGADIAAQPGWDPSLRRETPPDPAASARHRREAHQHATRAAVARQERENGLDVVRALSGHVQRHLARLLADPNDAPVIVADLLGARALGRRHVSQGRGARITVACACGQRVAVSDVDWMVCSGCGERGVLSWWVAQARQAVAEPMTLRAVRDWLLVEHGRDVPIETLRSWAKPREHLGLAAALEPTGRDARGRKLFDPVEVALLARERVVRTRRSA